MIEPDFLLDISAVAACFEDYGHHPLMYIINQMKPRANTYHTLLGNYAGTALDEIVKGKPGSTPSPMEGSIEKESEAEVFLNALRRNFREKALEYASCTDFDPRRFKQDAERQVRNMMEIVKELSVHHDLSKTLLEPSFICPRLGLQGRVDLMTSDMRLLVEQKSGKNICPQKHYVQALLYYGVLAANFGVGTDDVDISLLYSKFPLPDGLRHIDAVLNEKLFDYAIRFRNDVVKLLYGIAREGFGSITEQLRPEVLAPDVHNDSFFQRYELPRLHELLQPLHELSPLERAYFERMMTFVIREQIAAKTGGPSGYYHCTADMWRKPLEEKRDMGSIYTGLTLDKGTNTELSFLVPDQSDDFMPDFRRGDMVYVYSYPADSQPDITAAILHKGVLTDIMPDRVTVQLSDNWQPSHLTSHTYAIEHGSSDVNSGAAMRSLYTFVTSSQDKRDLLLGQRAPKSNHTLQLSHSYHPDYDEMLLHCKQASDYFLLVGPPGTGKTSMALRFIVEEELVNGIDNGNNPPSSHLLILSYTNRAVDEICGMLEDAGHDYLRLGNEHSCEPRYRNRLLATAVGASPRLDTIQRIIADARIVVSTTTMLQSRSYLLNVKQFSTIIVDEASQILEPNIIGLLARHGSKFILIGDYKQLPAVVQQSEEDSSVTDSLLHDIHLDNCRNSLFERLIRTEKTAGRSEFVGILYKHGRMHPDIAEFPCSHFYAEEHLCPVPLSHQRETNDSNLYLGRRVLFVDSEGPDTTEGSDRSDKCNKQEARIVARLLIGIRRHYADSFDPATTVGVIVPYRNQIATIRRCLTEMGADDLRNITIDTVERYQGSQRDVIIFSFTVQKAYQLDFLTSNTFVEDGRLIDRKLNVVMTRARKQLFMTGNKQILDSYPLYRQLIERYITSLPSL